MCVKNTLDSLLPDKYCVLSFTPYVGNDIFFLFYLCFQISIVNHISVCFMTYILTVGIDFRTIPHTSRLLRTYST